MAQITIYVDDNLKEQSEKLFNALGMNFTTAVNVFISQSVREGGIPFSVSTKTDPFYSESNMRVLRESIQAAKDGKLIAHELIDD
ncbi:MAG: type II toxin-antitoxin system RelB/DinJ family antitoxin [Peptococcaceae bacterium]|jgi:DNA-damage-inducible protein J|nr:type II toxin-antitoxin system RelB/DinJ family antitoxin [Peptococcaceae bacterium]